MRIRYWSSDVCSSDLIYLSPSNLGSSTDAIASRGGRMTLRAIGGLNALPYVDLSRRDLNGRTSKPIVSVRMGFSRSAERRVGKEWVSTCRYRWSQYH